MLRTLITGTSRLMRRPAFFLALVLLTAFACVGMDALAQTDIGEQARARVGEVAGQKEPISSELIDSIINIVAILAGLALLVGGILLFKAAELVNFTPLRSMNANKIQGALMALFGVALTGYVVYEMFEHTKVPMIYANAASAHGQEVDGLFQVTIAITLAAFFLVQAVLFFYAWRYAGTKKTRALYYPDNTKLEMIWTIIPAIVFAAMVLYGVTIWFNVNHPEDDPKRLTVEVVGEQFKWSLRYPGADGKLGDARFKLITPENSRGVDSTDKHAWDDRMPKVAEMYLPVNRQIEFKIRSKDVLHGVYAPHFRVNMYAQPGMPNRFVFEPVVTTAEMRKRLNKPNFDYELLCSQLCGASHYNMRVVIRIVEEAEYNKWLAEQPTFLPTEAPAEEKNLAETDDNAGLQAASQK